MNKEMGKWESEGGVKFLRRVGIKPGQKVLDFGARVGHYSIPAARVAGRNGLIYALDKDKDSLDELKRKAAEQGLENIMVIETRGSMKIKQGGDSVDAVLVYDVLHLVDNRKRLYKEVHRVLRQNGLFSVYPKHNKFDSPGWGLENMTPEDIKNEIENSGFHFKKEYCSSLSHDESINRGCVLNFKKLG